MSDQALMRQLIPMLHGGSYLARVTAVNDPDGIGRVKIRLFCFDAADTQDAEIWARVAVPFAGNNRGAFLIPDVGDEVLVSFVNSDPRQPIVIGGLWSGSTDVPETLGGSGDSVDRWSITGKAGTHIAIVEEQPSDATISFTTPGGVSGELTDAGGGKIEFRISGTTVTYEPQGVTVETGMNVKVQATQVEVTASMVTVNAAMSRFSGVVQCDTLISNSVISASYTPGAGNIW
ncbi:MAG: phage baseplate assembly protein V [Gammaproteobacteria bacterium]|nr:phage baseplate assembly protein V [Gammaproteobacteria bacterium]